METIRIKLRYSIRRIGVIIAIAALALVLKPVASVEPEIIDLGLVEAEHVYTFSFRIRNNGLLPLKITPDGTSDTCASLDLHEQWIYPWNSVKFGGEVKFRGPQSPWIGIATNDLIRQEIQVKVVGLFASHVHNKEVGTDSTTPPKNE